MQYFIAFLEGIITFVSPCMLPMLPVYLSYFAGQSTGEEQRRNTIVNALGFVLGFTLIFTLMGAFAGVIGGFLLRYEQMLHLVAGGVVVLFGLNFMGVLKLSIFKGMHRTADVDNLKFFSSLAFGAIFSLGWSPCVGVFLGSALMLASQQGSAMVGIMMLLCYSMGLGIPFLASALLIDRLNSSFALIKRNYRTIQLVSGLLLVVIGILMMTGNLERLAALLSL